MSLHHKLCENLQTDNDVMPLKVKNNCAMSIYH